MMIAPHQQTKNLTKFLCSVLSEKEDLSQPVNTCLPNTLPDLKLSFAPYKKSNPALTTQQMLSIWCLFLLSLA